MWPLKRSYVMCVNHNTSAGNEHDSPEKKCNQVLKITKGITI